MPETCMLCNWILLQKRWRDMHIKILSRQDDIIYRQDDMISHQDDIISRQDDIVSHQDDIVSHQDDIVSRQDDITSHQDDIISLHINTLRLRQNGQHFADDIFKRIFFNENVWISNKISLKFVPNGTINNIAALVQIMAWRRPGANPLSEPVMVSLPTRICVARPQWVNIFWSTYAISIGRNCHTKSVARTKICSLNICNCGLWNCLDCCSYDNWVVAAPIWFIGII